MAGFELATDGVGVTDKHVDILRTRLRQWQILSLCMFENLSGPTGEGE